MIEAVLKMCEIIKLKNSMETVTSNRSVQPSQPSNIDSMSPGGWNSSSVVPPASDRQKEAFNSLPNR